MLFLDGENFVAEMTTRFSGAFDDFASECLNKVLCHALGVCLVVCENHVKLELCFAPYLVCHGLPLLRASVGHSHATLDEVGQRGDPPSL